MCIHSYFLIFELDLLILFQQNINEMKLIKEFYFKRSLRLSRITIWILMAFVSISFTSCGDDEPNSSVSVPDQNVKIDWNVPIITQKDGHSEIGEKIQIVVKDAYGKYYGEDYVPVDFTLLSGMDAVEGKISGVSDSKYVIPVSFENPFTEAGEKKCILRVHYIIPNNGKIEKNYDMTLHITEATDND